MSATERLFPPAAADRPALRLLEKPLRARAAPVRAPAEPAWWQRFERWFTRRRG